MNKRIKLGRHSYGGNVDNRFHSTVNVGAFTCIGRVSFVGIEHPSVLGAISSFPFSELWQVENYPKCSGTPVTIGNDVWIGDNTIIIEGSIINDGAIVGAGTLVAGEVPPYTIYIGNPMRLLKKRFTDDQIEALLKIKWWEWQDNLIKERIQDFKDINIFLEKYGL